MSKNDNDLARTAVEDNLQGVINFLRQYPPFRQMEMLHVVYLVENCILRFYAKDELIIDPENGPIEHFYIVKQGRIAGIRNRTAEEPSYTFEITQGECFPVAALLAERPTRTAHIAVEDTFCLLLNKAAFAHLIAQCESFRNFCVQGISGLLKQAVQNIRHQTAATVGAQHTLETKLSELVLREPISANPELPLYEAVRLMDQQQVGSLPILDPSGYPVGIFTLRDLRTVIATPNADLQQPLANVMSTHPHYLSPQHNAFDATIVMAEYHIAHVCVVENKRLVGMVSERDLFALQRMDLVHLARALRHAASIDDLIMLREDVQQLVERMTAQGASPEQLTHLITLLNDHTVSRVIELVLQQETDPVPEFTWLVFGSEARQEQTLHTDQDNGMLFDADSPEHAEQIRQRLLPVATKINQALDKCGFTWCPGNIMASNPELCLSFTEWRQRFAKIVRDSSAENLLASTIYFDWRSVYGAEDKVEQLREGFLAQIKNNPAFQRALAQNALQFRPPLGGWFKDFSLSKKGENKDTLDLKKEGLTPFVDGMRVLALAHAVPAVNTLDRLRALTDAGIIEKLDGEAYAEAYHFIQLLRMQGHHQQVRDNKPYSNRITPRKLNNLDRRILRESLRQAQRLQASLSFRYKL